VTSLLTASEVWAAPPGASGAVVRGVSLRLGPGEWVALSGPNGGGKTTLALALAGLRPIRSGRITLDPALGGDGRGPRRLAMILQDPSAQLFTGSVREELAYTARNVGSSEEDAAGEAGRWAARLGLENELDRDPHTLSAGRQQLVLIGAALASSPAILIADESGSHLDPDARERVLGLIRAQVSQGLSVLWLTQSAREIAAADRLIWVGEPAPPPGPAAFVEFRERGAGVARVRVEPRARAEGPLVRTAHPIDFELPSRGVLALLGPNGAGKSVLLASLCGLIETGQVTVEWRAAEGPPPLFVSQYPESQIFEELIRDELLYAARKRGVSPGDAEASALSALERLGLSGGWPLRRSWDLSSGERRMTQVVAGLIAPSRLLALDEPSAGLDPGRSAALSRLIRERSQGGPILVATQDPAWAEGLGAEVIALGEGAEKWLPSLSKKTD